MMKTLMGACQVEVCYTGIEHTLELLLAEDQQVVKAFLTDTPGRSARISHWRGERDTAF
jgi:hypothetical protein